MSITMVSETSIRSLHERADGFASHVEKLTRLVELHGPIVGSDVIAKLCEQEGLFADYNAHSRLNEAWRNTGSLRKTGERREADQSGKLGDVWAFVPDVGDARMRAQLEYWTQSLERHTKEAAKVADVLARDREMIATFSAELAGLRAA